MARGPPKVVRARGFGGVSIEAAHLHRGHVIATVDEDGNPAQKTAGQQVDGRSRAMARESPVEWWELDQGVRE
ncbi:MAG: hypothetical protein Q4P32_08240, partial [Micrococcales bacterium]|nr:hypothetical protein [Micrococcales bacterium]